MIPKIEYQILLDPELNQGNKYPGIKQAIEDAQILMLPEVILEARIIVHKKLVAFLEGKPYEYKCVLDNTGLDTNKHNGIVKITLI